MNNFNRRDILKCSTIGFISINVFSASIKAQQIGTRNTWPTIQNNPQNTGQSGLSGPVDEANKQWSVDYSDSGGVSPIISEDYVLFDGTVLNKRDGSGVRNESWYGTPVIRDNIYYCLNSEGVEARQIDTGDVVWTSTPSISLSNLSNIKYFDDKLYYTAETSEDNYDCFAVNAKNGEKVWNSPAGRVSPGGIAVTDEEIYISIHRNNPHSVGTVSTIISLDTTTGERVWTPYPNVGTGSRMVAPTADEDNIYISNDGVLYCIDKVTKTELWKYDLNGETSSSPAVSNDILIGGSENNIFAIDTSNGDEIWSISSEYIGVSPIICDGIVYVGDIEQSFYAIDLQDGSVLWEYQSEDGFNEAPALSDGNLYIVESAGLLGQSLHCLSDIENTEPEAKIKYSPEDPITDQEIQFDASNSEDDHGIESYNWKFNNGNNGSKSGITVTKSFSQPGSHNVKLQITDEYGLTDSNNVDIRVSRPAEVPDASFDYTPSKPSRGDEVQFDASSSVSPDGYLTDYVWDIEGEKKTGEKVTHTFEQPGEYSISLEVSDDTGLSNSTKKSIEVIREKLSAEITGDRTDIYVGQEAIINLSLVNFITNNSLTIQLILQKPSGVSVSGISGADEGSGQYTAVSELPPGGETNIMIRLSANEPGKFEITGRVIYIDEHNNENDQILDAVTVEAEQSTSSDNTPSDNTEEDITSDNIEENTTSDDSPGFGIGSSLASIGGAYLALRRLTDPGESKE